MTRPMLQRVALAGVFAAGILSIMGTMSTPPDFKFEDVSLSPRVRCPGTDARLQWSLSRPARVAVESGGTISDMGFETALALPAAGLDAGPDRVRFTLRFLEYIPYAPLGGAELTTVRGITQVAEPLRHGGKFNWNYSYRLDPDTWDRRLRVVRVSIAEPAHLQCSTPESWEPRWWAARRPGEQFALNADNAFERNFEPPVRAAGEWIVVADPVERPAAKGEGYRPACPAPTLEFSVVCVDGAAAE